MNEEEYINGMIIFQNKINKLKDKNDFEMLNQVLQERMEFLKENAKMVLSENGKKRMGTYLIEDEKIFEEIENKSIQLKKFILNMQERKKIAKQYQKIKRL